LIAVDDYAENNIIVIPGANGRVGTADLERLSKALVNAKILLLQLEIPLEIVTEAAKIAHDMGVTVILDPAPAQKLPDELFPWVDILTPNQTEASILMGFRVGDEGSVRRAAQVLLGWGVQHVIIKMGDLGAYIANEDGSQHYPAIPVVAIDTVAAGDAFNGALAAALMEEKSFDDAVRWGLAGGALAVTKAGAQEAMPERPAVLKLLAEYFE
jgi:ribokinase